MNLEKVINLQSNVENTSRYKELKQEQSKIEKKIVQNNINISNYTKKIELIEKAKAENTSRYKQIIQEQSKIENQIEQNNINISNYTKKIELIEKAKAENTSRYKELKQEKDNLIENIFIINNEMLNQNLVQDTKEIFLKLFNFKSSKREELNKLTAKKDEIEKTINELQKNINQIEKEIEKYTKQIELIEKEKAEKESRYKQLNQEQSKIENQIEQNELVKYTTLIKKEKQAYEENTSRYKQIIQEQSKIENQIEQNELVKYTKKNELIEKDINKYPDLNTTIYFNLPTKHNIPKPNRQFLHNSESNLDTTVSEESNSTIGSSDFSDIRRDISNAFRNRNQQDSSSDGTYWNKGINNSSFRKRLDEALEEFGTWDESNLDTTVSEESKILDTKYFEKINKAFKKLPNFEQDEKLKKLDKVKVNLENKNYSLETNTIISFKSDMYTSSILDLKLDKNKKQQAKEINEEKAKKMGAIPKGSKMVSNESSTSGCKPYQETKNRKDDDFDKDKNHKSDFQSSKNTSIQTTKSDVSSLNSNKGGIKGLSGKYHPKKQSDKVVNEQQLLLEQKYQKVLELEKKLEKDKKEYEKKVKDLKSENLINKTKNENDKQGNSKWDDHIKLNLPDVPTHKLQEKSKIKTKLKKEKQQLQF